MESNVNETENTVRRHSQQVQQNPNAHGQAINSENSINQEYLERNQLKQDAANINTNAGTNLETLGRDTMNNILYQEARQGRSRQAAFERPANTMLCPEIIQIEIKKKQFFEQSY